ncbi:MAG: hypothetical protein LLF99_13180 [Desulfobacteraceae bacterium]|nr:hypothetical protein [Desulfobacteraceae bacterium]
MHSELEVFHVGEAAMRARRHGAAPVLRWTCDRPLRFACLPGVFYGFGGEDFDARGIADLPVMPWYCKVSVPPQTIDGRSYLCGIYVKAPVCIFLGDEALGLRFNPVLPGNRPVPLFFSFRRVGGRTEFELALLRSYVLRRRSREQFETWSHQDRTFSEETVELRDGPGFPEGCVEHRLLRAGTAGEILEQVAGREECAAESSAPSFGDLCRRHFNKSFSWLLGMYHPWADTYVSMRARNRNTAVRGMILPAYNTLASDFYQLSRYYPRDEGVLRLSNAACRLHLRKGAHVSLSDGGLVFRNTAHLSVNRRGVVFSDHLGVGLAGYPGGQATVVRSLAERWTRGDRNPAVRTVGEAGARWLRRVQSEDGSWWRTWKGPEYTEPEESLLPSPGACAEGAMALMEAYEAFGGREDLLAAERALGYVNGKLADSMVLTGYFRDCSQEEAEAASGIFIALANLRAFEVSKDRNHLRAAETALRYCLGWHRWWFDDGMDSIQHSFTPRIATCQTVWAAQAYLAFHTATGDDFWKRAAARSVACLDYDDSYPGYGDGVYNDEELKPYPVGFECSYSASAILRFAMTALREDMERGKPVLPERGHTFPEDIRPPSPASDLLQALRAAKSCVESLARPVRAVLAGRGVPGGTKTG